MQHVRSLDTTLLRACTSTTNGPRCMQSPQAPFLRFNATQWPVHFIRTFGRVYRSCHKISTHGVWTVPFSTLHVQYNGLKWICIKIRMFEGHDTWEAVLAFLTFHRILDSFASALTTTIYQQKTAVPVKDCTTAEWRNWLRKFQGREMYPSNKINTSLSSTRARPECMGTKYVTEFAPMLKSDTCPRRLG
jgi:hypothetical protein